MQSLSPDAGDLVWVDFDPVRGTEQAGRRPALVLSAVVYNDESGRAIVCPITSNIRPWPFKVVLPDGLRTRGAILVDQIRAVHRATRVFDHIERVPRQVLREVQSKLAALVGMDDAMNRATARW
jgi:mRNA interferase MazF